MRILCLNGGGVLSVYTVRTIKNIETMFNVKLIDAVDLIVGTSAGAIVAAALSLNIETDQIYSMILDKSKSIFALRWPEKILNATYFLPLSLIRAPYQLSNLRAAIESIVSKHGTTLTYRKPIMFPTVDITSWTPFEFRLFDSVSHGINTPNKLTLALSAAAAAPTFFPAQRINNHYYIDGGIYANCPDYLALNEAMTHFNAHHESIHLLSIGTTHSSVPVHGWEAAPSGIRKWLAERRLPSIMLDAQERTSIFMVQRLLQSRYIRLNEFTTRSFRMDDIRPESIDTLCAYADRTMERINSDAHLNMRLCRFLQK